jgi:glycosyltransferase involved in cell wall biosynthesis
MILGIDATHIVGGGALGHLKLLLNNHKNSSSIISKIYIWGPKKTLNALIANKNIIKCHNIIFEYNFIFKTFWQFFFLKKNLKKFKCNILFVPSGIFYTNFKPVVTVAQNLMPFNSLIVEKHFPHFLYFKMRLQKFFFQKSFNNSSKIIFLSKYSQKYINLFLNHNKFNQIIIPHAIDSKLIQFFNKTLIPANLKRKKNIKICLISDINFNKNYELVIKAVSLVRKKYNVQLFWIGDKNPILFSKFNKLKNSFDKFKNFIFYKGLLSHKKTMNFLKRCDIFLYSSFCETFGVAVLEGMASKLPIVILNHPLYKEILNNNAFFFKENNVNDLKKKLLTAIEKTNKQKEFYKKNLKLFLKKYNSQKISNHTWKVFEEVVKPNYN